MPALQRGHARKLPSGKWQLRYYDADGDRKTGGTFSSKSAAMQHYREAIEPRLNGTEPVIELTFAELVDVYLGEGHLGRDDRTALRHVDRRRARRPRRTSRCDRGVARGGCKGGHV